MYWRTKSTVTQINYAWLLLYVQFHVDDMHDDWGKGMWYKKIWKTSCIHAEHKYKLLIVVAEPIH